MSTLDGSIINIALPTMSKELNTTTEQITWVVTIYLIIISSIILIFGRLADLIGKTKITKIGWAIFILGSFLSGFNMGLGLKFLIFSRIVQAVGAAMMMSTSFGIIAQIFPKENQARAMAVISMFVSIGSIAGPALGGFILQIVSWNYIFFINVPIGIGAWIFGIHELPKDKVQGKWSDLDFRGGFLMATVIVLSFLSINFGAILGWSNPIIITALTISFILLIAFIIFERKTKTPLIDLTIFQSKLFSLSLVMSLLNFTVSMFSSILLPFYLEDYHGYEPGLSGIFMMCYPLAMLISSPIAGALGDKIDKEIVTFIGITGIVLSQVGYLMINYQTPSWWVAMVLLLQGCSVGIFQSPNNALIMSTVDKKHLGIAGSINSLVRNIAFILGTSLSTILLFLYMSMNLKEKVNSYLPNHPGAFLQGMHFAFIFAFSFTLLTWILALLRLIGKIRLSNVKNA